MFFQIFSKCFSDIFSDAWYLADFFVDLGGILALGIGVLPGEHFQHTHPKGIDVDFLGVTLLVVHFGSHELWCAYSSIKNKGKGFVENLAIGLFSVVHTDYGVLFAKFHLGSAHVANLDLSLMAIDENVVALDVSVDDGRTVGVQVMEPL